MYKRLGPWKCHFYPGDFTAVYVPSSRKKDQFGTPWLYTVIVNDDGTTNCDCSSYNYRGYCKHDDAVKAYIKERMKSD